MSSTMPWTVKIETTEGCNRSCSFCPVPKIYGKHYNFLTAEVAAEIVKQLIEWDADRKWRFELAMLGEPTMNKDLPAILKVIRTIPKAQITLFTNGDILKRDLSKAIQLFDSGLNILAVDCYDKENLEFYSGSSLKLDGKTRRYNYFQDNYPLYSSKPGGWKLRDLVIIDDIASTQDIAKLRKMHNYGGNVDNSVFGVKELTEPLKKGCEKPFRDLVISHRGDVLVCCLDANKDLKIGNIFQTPLKDIWYGKGFMSIRKSLANGERIGKPCEGCNWFGGFKQYIAYNDFKNLMNA